MDEFHVRDAFADVRNDPVATLEWRLGDRSAATGDLAVQLVTDGLIFALELSTEPWLIVRHGLHRVALGCLDALREGRIVVECDLGRLTKLRAPAAKQDFTHEGHFATILAIPLVWIETVMRDNGNRARALAELVRAAALAAYLSGSDVHSPAAVKAANAIGRMTQMNAITEEPILGAFDPLLITHVSAAFLYWHIVAAAGRPRQRAA